MDNLPKVLIELEIEYAERRHEFLDAAFKICWIALDWSGAQLDLGNFEVAASEMHNVDKSRETISPFLSQIKDAARRRHFETELRRVEKALGLLGDQLRRFGPRSVTSSETTTLQPASGELKTRPDSRTIIRAATP